MAKAGYGEGDPKKIAEMETDWVLKILEYENFLRDFDEEMDNLNYTEPS